MQRREINVFLFECTIMLRNLLTTIILVSGLASTSLAQNNSLFQRRGVEPVAPREQLENSSWIYVPAPPPRQIAVEDLIYIRVNEMQRMSSDGEVNRRKNALYDALLADWVVLNGLKSIKPSPQSDGDPRIQGRLNELYRAEGELETSERLTLNIAAKVVDIQPNGNLVLEARKQVRNNNEVWEVALTGICRAADIGEDNLILSDRIYDLRIYKRELGHIRDSYRRGWMLRLMDRFSAF